MGVPANPTTLGVSTIFHRPEFQIFPAGKRLIREGHRVTKIGIDSKLYERAKQAAAKCGYSSVDELIANAIELELKRLGEADAEKQVAEQLRGLGYIE